MNEKVVNNALSGLELRELLKVDFEKLLANEGLLSPHVAYGRLGYTITLKLHLSNPSLRDYPSITVKGGEPVPLVNPSKDAEVAAQTLHREIDSPNKERVRVGIPIPVVTRGLDGTTQTRQIKYPPQPELGEGDVTLEMNQATMDAKKEWNL